MGTINKGGRGRVNPWKSLTVRIPEPLLDRVEELKEEFLLGAVVPLLTESNSFIFPTQEQAIDQARRILTHKKSAKESLGKLLTYLYGEDIRI